MYLQRYSLSLRSVVTSGYWLLYKPFTISIAVTPQNFSWTSKAHQLLVGVYRGKICYQSILPLPTERWSWSVQNLVFPKYFLKSYFWKSQQTTTKAWKLPRMQIVSEKLRPFSEGEAYLFTSASYWCVADWLMNTQVGDRRDITFNNRSCKYACMSRLYIIMSVMESTGSSYNQEVWNNQSWSCIIIFPSCKQKYNRKFIVGKNSYHWFGCFSCSLSF